MSNFGFIKIKCTSVCYENKVRNDDRQFYVFLVGFTQSAEVDAFLNSILQVCRVTGCTIPSLKKLTQIIFLEQIASKLSF